MQDAASYSDEYMDQDDELNLMSEHFNIIYARWLDHLTKQKLPGNCLRILHAIFYHTVGSKQREAHLTGKRLQKITCIRYDHAIHIVKKLEKSHVILRRSDHYRDYLLSINFNFDSWGAKHALKSEDLSNDPHYLLPEQYQDSAIDLGNDLGFSEEDESELSLNFMQRSVVPKANTRLTASSDELSSQESIENSHDRLNTEVMQTVLKQLTHLENKLQQLEETVTEQRTQEKERFEPMLLALEQRLTMQYSQYAGSIDSCCDEVKENDQSPDYTQLQHKITKLEQQSVERLQELESQLQQQQQREQLQQKEFSELEQREQRKNNELEQNLAWQQELEKQLFEQQQKEEIQRNTLYQYEEMQVRLQQKISELERTATQQIEAEKQRLQEQYSSTLMDPNVIEYIHNNQMNHEGSHQQNVEEETVVSDHLDQQELQKTTETTPTPENVIPDLNYPDNLTEDVRIGIPELALGTGEHAQLLVDLLSKRLMNMQDPLYSPLGYFINLVKKLQRGEIDIEGETARLPNVSAEQSEYDKEFERLKSIYTEVQADYTHYESLYVQEAEQAEMSRDEYLENCDLVKFWQNLGDKLEQSKIDMRDLIAQKNEKHE
jgi:hypothetical protein